MSDIGDRVWRSGHQRPLATAILPSSDSCKSVMMVSWPGASGQGQDVARKGDPGVLSLCSEHLE